MNLLQSLELFLLFFEELYSSSLPAPPFIPESAAHGDLDMLDKLLTTGETTLGEWIVGREGDAPLTTEEERRPQGSADLSTLEGTSRDFVYYPRSHAMEGRGPREL